MLKLKQIANLTLHLLTLFQNTMKWQNFNPAFSEQHKTNASVGDHAEILVSKFLEIF